MDLGLNQRVALVLGSSSGLGLACAGEFVAEGAHVMLAARSPERLRQAAEHLRAEYGAAAEIGTQACDVTRGPDIEAAVSATVARFGRLDILVTNAGGPPPGTFAELGIEDFERGVELNLMSAIRATRAALPHMLQRQWGRIVHITSIAMRQPIERLVVSNTVRSAFFGLTRSFANEYASRGVLMHNVCPGYTRTERLGHLEQHLAQAEHLETLQVRARWEAQIPAGRLAEPREVAAVVVFLCSDRASYMSGTTIAVDGGYARGIP